MTRAEWLTRALQKAPKLDAERKAAIAAALPPVVSR